MQIIQHFLIQFGEKVNFFDEKKPHGKQLRIKESDSKIELRVREKTRKKNKV